jgi:hypothetical protein
VLFLQACNCSDSASQTTSKSLSDTSKHNPVTSKKTIAINDLNEKPMTCKLTTPELQKRKTTVIADIKKLIKEKTELTNGFAYRFDGSDKNLDL